KKKKIKYVEPPSREVFNDDEYPRRLSPDDIYYSIEFAKNKLIEEQAKKEADSPLARRNEIILEVLDQMKISEAARVAKRIAERQQKIAAMAPEELEELAETTQNELANLDEAEEQLAQAKSLQRFSKGNKTLLDEAGQLVSEDVESAANVVKQWVGNVIEAEK
ncbi:MAG: hypothetical protein ACRC2T_11790, partial [Thermoguttaceae bacterium]